MTRRMLCPFHVESSPSCIIYDTGYFCFGCGKRGPLSDLKLTVGDIRRVKPTDLAKEVEYVKSLPTGLIRGLTLPIDNTHYYILWADGSYYKKRTLTGMGSRYLCPAGHTKPLFISSEYSGSRLFIVEGELNAMSLSLAKPPGTVVSPGSCVEFTSRKYMDYYTKFSTIHIIADADRPGIEAAKELKILLLKHTPHVTINLMEIDLNDVLTTKGLPDVKAEVSKMLQH